MSKFLIFGILFIASNVFSECISADSLPTVAGFTCPLMGRIGQCEAAGGCMKLGSRCVLRPENVKALVDILCKEAKDPESCAADQKVDSESVKNACVWR